MCRRFLLGAWLSFLFVFVGVTWGQSVPGSSSMTEPGRREQAAAQHEKSDDPQIAAMRSDLQRMRVLVNQMQMNLAFVQNTNTPLKHEFELEIEMWQILVNQMERRLESMGGKPAAGSQR